MDSLRENLSLGNINPLIGKQNIPGSRTDTLYARYTTLISMMAMWLKTGLLYLKMKIILLIFNMLDIDKMEMTGIFQVTFVRDIMTI